MPTDTERLDALEACCNKGGCPSVIYDDNGNWAVAQEGTQNIRMEDSEPLDIQHWVPADAFRPSIREAIDLFMAEQQQQSSHYSPQEPKP